MTRRAVVLVLIVSALFASVSQAADYDVVNEDIWPSQNDVALTAGNGKKLLENQWQEVMTATMANNIVYSGFALPASSVNLNISVPLGQALIKGRFVDIPGSTTITATASQTNYVFLKFARDGSSLATGAKFEVNTTGTAPADSTAIGTLIANGSAITSTTDARLLGPHGIIALTSGTEWVVPAGLTRIFVEVLGASGGGGGGAENSAAGDGAAGTAGGTTSFDTYSAIGGSGGVGGHATASAAAGSQGTAHGTASGGQVNLTGAGRPGGVGGGGGGAAQSGAHGGHGGYVASYRAVTQGAEITFAIGAAGASGAGGTGAAGADGGAGRAGQAGVILIHY